MAAAAQGHPYPPLIAELRRGYARKELVYTMCCPNGLEGKSVHSCAERPHLKVAWEDGRHREGQDATIV